MVRHFIHSLYPSSKLVSIRTPYPTIATQVINSMPTLLEVAFHGQLFYGLIYFNVLCFIFTTSLISPNFPLILLHVWLSRCFIFLAFHDVFSLYEMQPSCISYKGPVEKSFKNPYSSMQGEVPNTWLWTTRGGNFITGGDRDIQVFTLLEV
jgi:hypothetical protein